VDRHARGVTVDVVPQLYDAAATGMLGETGSTLAKSRSSARIVRDEVGQDSEEVRHGLASTGFATLDDAGRDALLRDVAGLNHAFGKRSTAYATGPPQARAALMEASTALSRNAVDAPGDVALDVRPEARGAHTITTPHGITSVEAGAEARSVSVDIADPAFGPV